MHPVAHGQADHAKLAALSALAEPGADALLFLQGLRRPDLFPTEAYAATGMFSRNLVPTIGAVIPTDAFLLSTRCAETLTTLAPPAPGYAPPDVIAFAQTRETTTAIVVIPLTTLFRRLHDREVAMALTEEFVDSDDDRLYRTVTPDQDTGQLTYCLRPGDAAATRMGAETRANIRHAAHMMLNEGVATIQWLSPGTLVAFSARNHAFTLFGERQGLVSATLRRKEHAR